MRLQAIFASIERGQARHAPTRRASEGSEKGRRVRRATGGGPRRRRSSGCGTSRWPASTTSTAGTTAVRGPSNVERRPLRPVDGPICAIHGAGHQPIRTLHRRVGSLYAESARRNVALAAKGPSHGVGGVPTATQPPPLGTRSRRTVRQRASWISSRSRRRLGAASNCPSRVDRPVVWAATARGNSRSTADKLQDRGRSSGPMADRGHRRRSAPL